MEVQTSVGFQQRQGVKDCLVPRSFAPTDRQTFNEHFIFLHDFVHLLMTSKNLGVQLCNQVKVGTAQQGHCFAAR
jgi:hypothetical protein